MFRKILIANRGEIAVRVIRACREMGIQTVAVYSKAEEEALHVQLADEAICIGPPAVRDSYLNILNLLSATVLTNAEAIHPGYGLLSENARFVHMCDQCRVVFIGPPVSAMEAMGNKLSARRTMQSSGVPIIPGTTEPVADLAEAKRVGREIGYPLLVKAAAGGGGRGIRRVDDEDGMENALATARAEALSGFGDDTVYIEKLISGARHVEVQVLCDKYGNAVHLFERDCSLQRKRQKLVEESPSPFITAATRARMGEAAVRAAVAVGYVGAGTIEFLVDEDRNFYFMEMNARIQVEHPVTEMVTGIDIVREQLLIASGLPLSFSQSNVVQHGHAIECRINAEDSTRGFAPSCGKVHLQHTPGGIGVRFDTLLYDGCTVSPWYDSMLGKLIVHADDRAAAIARMKRALPELALEGLEVNTQFQLELIGSDWFAEDRFTIDTVTEMTAASKPAE